MSSEALAWAFKVNLKPSALKFTLVALCECANYKTGHIYPSIAHLQEITGQDRKTLIANIAKLEQLGLLVDTGERSGRTGQIKVYRATTETVPKTEQFQKRNSPVFPSKQSQKRDTEPSREPSVDKANALPTKRARICAKPDGVCDELWADWLSHRDGKFSQTALDGFKREADKAGWTVAEAFTEAIERKWQGFKADWVKENGHNGRTSGNPSDNARRVDGFTAALRHVANGPSADPFDHDGQRM